jgi:hypothetical protein
LTPILKKRVSDATYMSVDTDNKILEAVGKEVTVTEVTEVGKISIILKEPHP